MESPCTELLNEGKALTIAGRSAAARAKLEEAAAAALRERHAEKAADALDWLSWLAWIELDGKRLRRYAKRLLAIDLPKSSPEAFRVAIRRATCTLQLGDARGAERLLEEAENVSQLADIDAFSSYLSIKGDVQAACGESDVAVHHSRLAVEIARKRADRYELTRKLMYCAYALQANGQIDDALETYLEAASVSAEGSLTWEVPFNRTRAAACAYTLGDLSRAAKLVRDAFRSGANHRWMYVERSALGVAVALATGDDALLARAIDERVIGYAFASADAYAVGRVVGAYDRYFRSVGRCDDASRLLHEGLRRLSSPDCGWSVLQSAAEHGDADDVAHAERLLSVFPRQHPIARAHRLLFDAFTARRSGDGARCERRAGEARSAFEACEWRVAAARCAELAGRLGEAKRMYDAMGAHAESKRVASLRARPGRPRRGYESSRQRHEIARMIAGGATNKTIADRLGVSPRTIKYRISELYAAEGIASRKEFMELVASGSVRV